MNYTHNMNNVQDMLLKKMQKSFNENKTPDKDITNSNNNNNSIFNSIKINNDPYNKKLSDIFENNIIDANLTITGELYVDSDTFIEGSLNVNSVNINHVDILSLIDNKLSLMEHKISDKLSLIQVRLDNIEKKLNSV